MPKINIIDLFAGCGGLTEGFEKSNHYNTLACVEWEKAPCQNLIKRLNEKWRKEDSEQRVLRFDIQRTEELLFGWNDSEYGYSKGLDAVIGNKTIDLIIGGPPCQAYSIAGRVRDENGMRDDYRNYLFEGYMNVVSRYKPKAFVFENVPGILSAAPTGEPIIDIITRAFNDAGYVVLNDLSEAVVDFSDYGVPQNRKRLIILGLRRDIYGDNAQHLLREFYKLKLPKRKLKKKNTVRDAISDLPALYPLSEEMKIGRTRFSHSLNPNSPANHIPRWHSKRDQEIFRILASDIESGLNQYVSIEALKKLYTECTGKISNVHKYYVLRWDEPSNLIPAHIYKDGLRHVHPDPSQARSITVREAARLQGFPDDYEFVGSLTDSYKMIGNAVPVNLAYEIALEIYKCLK